MPASPNSQWPDEDVLVLKKLVSDGCSYGYIADKLGKTRNAVAGKVYRMGLAETRPKIESPPPKPRPERQPKPARLARAVSFNGGVPLLPVQQPLTPQEIALVSPADASPVRRKRLFDLDDSECRWPLGDPQAPDFGFCAAPRIAGPHPYCAKHQRISRPGWRG